MGTPEFAVESLKAIHENGFTVSAVVTSCDKPAGRGMKLQESAVKVYAQEMGLKVLQPENMKSDAFSNELNAIDPDLQVVVAFRMLPESVWSLPKKGTINLHASLLPNYRGAAPINHAIMNGETKTGLTTFFIEKEIDTGNIILQKEVEILPDENAGELHDKLMIEGGKLVIETLNAIITGTVNPVSQRQLIGENETFKTANKIFKENCIVRWNDTAENVYNFIRGLSPYPAAWTTLKNKNGKELTVKLLRAGKSIENHNLRCATILSDNKTFFKVAVCDGFIDIIELQPEGKKQMKTGDWLNGFDVSNFSVKDPSF